MKSKIKNPYELHSRFMMKNGQWSDWSKGIGQWYGIETVQKQITMLKRGKQDREMEFAIIKDGKNLDYNGNEIEGTIKFDRR
jgi:hypothetical protein